MLPIVCVLQHFINFCWLFIPFLNWWSCARYEAFVCWEEQSEKVAAGILEHLLQHVPEINGLYAKGFDANFDFRLPENLQGAQWFSKATVRRFLSKDGPFFTLLLLCILITMDKLFMSLMILAPQIPTSCWFPRFVKWHQCYHG